MEALVQGKAQGDGLFKDGHNAEAVACYEALLLSIDAAQVGSEAEEVQALKKAVLNNLSMVHLKSEDYSACAATCTQGILLDNANLKAYYRRAQAYKAMGRIDDTFFTLAIRDVDAILQLETLNPQAKALRIETIKAQQEVETEKKYSYIKKDLAHNSRAAKEARERGDGGEEEEEGGGPKPCTPPEQQQQTDADSGGHGLYSFMNPNWQPAPADVSGKGPVQSAFGFISSGATAAVSPASTQSVSMKGLLKEARRIAAAQDSSGSGFGSIAATQAQQAHATALPVQVIEAISELAQLEAEAAKKVEDRIAWKAARAAEKKKSARYESVLGGAAGGTLVGGANPSALSAWEELQRVEVEAERTFRDRMLLKASKA